MPLFECNSNLFTGPPGNDGNPGVPGNRGRPGRTGKNLHLHGILLLINNLCRE